MSKGKSEFRFIINADPNLIENIIQGYLRVNEFNKIANNYNANYYLCNDLINGKKSIEYYINGNEVIILAYLGTYEKPKSLDGLVGALPKQVFRQKLSELFSELQKLNGQSQNNMYNNNQGMNNPNQFTNNNYNGMNNTASMFNDNQFANNNMYNTNQNINNTNNMYNNNQNINNANSYNPAMQANDSFNTFTKQNNSRNEKFAIFGFVLSLLGIFIALFGYTYGALIIIFEFYCANLGLKTQTKRGLSIATIVIACINILITLFNIVFLFI